MQSNQVRYAVCSALLMSLAACGSSGDSSSASTTNSGSSSGGAALQYGTVPLLVSDASSDDWALIGVRVLSIALVPQGGGSNVTVYTAGSSGAPYINLVQLDQLAEILGNVQVPVGTYTGAVITVGGNPGDVLLTTAADPETGFAGAASTSIPSSSIQIQHTQGTAGSLSVPVDVNFVSPLTVSTTSSNALDLEFDLSNPALIIAHQPPALSGATIWAVNFKGPVRHSPVASIADLVLRHTYGTVTAVASDGSSLSIDKDYATQPVVSPETAVQSTTQLTILPDATNGTLFYDLDAGTKSTVTSFANIAALAAGEYVRVAARYQPSANGPTLVATRVYASSQFNRVWLSPEGHVLDVNASQGTLTVTNDEGLPVPLAINASTEFYFHDGVTPIGSGTSFMANNNVVRGFKVHAEVDPLSTATPMVATSIDIETATYAGAITSANDSNFTYTRNFVLRPADDYTATLDYISSSSANGTDGSGNAITGFKYWNFAYPTLVTSGSSAVTDFVQAVNADPNLQAWGATYARWADPANPSGWSAPWSVLLPVPLPIATVTVAVSGSGTSYSFTATPLGSGTASTIDVSSANGAATLVYQVDRSNGIVTVSNVDLTTPSGLSTFMSALTTGTPVKAYGVPLAGGGIQAYVVAYFTGVVPTI